jgi:ketosteroid isomerase-like protein
MSQEDLSVVRRMYDALARGDVFTFMGGLDPEIEWTVAPGFPYAEGNPYRGRDAVMQLFGRIMGEWKSFKIVGEEFLDGGEQVVVLGHYSATCTATGKPVLAQFAHVGVLRSGKVVRYRQFADTAQFVRAMSRGA